MTSAQLDIPDTLTPAAESLTPTTKALLCDGNSTWGRLFPMLKYMEPIDLEKNTCTLGRSDRSDIRITEGKFPERNLNNISKSHFVITKDVQESFPCITDLSKNGTFINGTRVARNQKIILQHLDEIAIGVKDLKVYQFKNFQSTDNYFLPPDLRKKYEISRTLGEGACGVVKLIYEKHTFKQYAVKKIAKATGSRSRSMNHPAKIKNEIDILKAVSHPCIISVSDVVETENNVFIVMEYMEGGELTRLIRNPQLMSERQSKFLFYQIVLAIQYLHGKKITHRDLKPENILLKHDGRYDTIIKLTDFGLSKYVRNTTLMRTACGTPFYVAPEVLNNSITTYNSQVDVWSLGVILYYMLCQQLPFRANNDIAQAKLVLRGSFHMTGDVWDNISDDAKDLIKRMLTVDAARRITIKGIINHPWISKDVALKHEIDELLYSEMCTDSDIEVSESDSSDSILNPSKRCKLSPLL